MPQTSGRLQQSNDELLSDEVKEIVSYRPNWMIRKGNVVFLIVILSLLAITWFISYPDIIDGSARLVSLNTPKMISSRVQGKIAELFVTNGEKVEKGKHLGCMESTASYAEVVQLRKWIDEIIVKTKDGNYDCLAQSTSFSLFNLGELQNSYQGFQNQLVETKQLLATGYYQSKRKALQKDLQLLSRLKTTTYYQKELLEQDKQLQKRELEAYETLEREKVIAPLELNQYKSRLLSKNQNISQIEGQLTTNDVASHNKQKEIMDLDKQELDQEQKFHSSLLQLKSDIEKWLQQYVLIAPETGQVVFISFLQNNQLIGVDQELFYIQPQSAAYYAELVVSQKGYGKIKDGQQVILKIEGYPNEEFGYLKGRVGYIAQMPNARDSFLVRVNLPHQLRTNYNKEITFSNNLLAHGQIITDDRKLFDRMLGQLKKLGRE